MNSESIKLAQELKKSINLDIYKTDQDNSGSENNSKSDNIQEIEKKYLAILAEVYKSSNAILSGKINVNPNFLGLSEKTRQSALRFFNHLYDIILNISEQDKIEYKNALENYFRIYPWIIKNELELP